MILKKYNEKKKADLIWLIRFSIGLFWFLFFICMTFFLLWLICGDRLWEVWFCKNRADVYFLVTNLITAFSFTVTSALTIEKIKKFIILKRQNTKFYREKRKRLKSK